MPFNEVENCARLLKVKRALNNKMNPDKLTCMMIVELEKVIHDMCDDYEDRTDECLLTLAHKAMRT